MKKSITIALIFALFVSNGFSQVSLTRGMEVKWLSGLTYGISGYAYGNDSISLYEMVVDTGLYNIIISTTGPAAGVYTNNDFYFMYTLPAIGDYTITQHINTEGTISGLYGSTHTIYSDSIPLTPTDCHASFFIAPDTGNVNDWILYDFSTSSGAMTYFWDFGDGTTSTLASPAHTYSALGNYMICLTISDGVCTDTYCDSAFLDINQPGSGVLSIRTMQVIAGIDDVQSKMNFDVYPNPAEDELTISWSNEAPNNNLSISIFDLMGRELKNTDESSSAMNKINIGQLPPGIYLLKVSDGKISGTKRFIKK